MSFSNSLYRIAGSAVVVTMLFAVPAWAQESGQIGPQSMQPMEGRDAEQASIEKPYRFAISFGVGTASGGNPVGSIVDEDAGEVLTFDLDSGVFISGKAATRIWWRLGAEVEFAYGEPGVLLTTTNLQGANFTEEPFGDYSFGMLSASARLDLIDARITPFLLGGIAATFNSYPDGESSTEPGFLFGGGLDFQAVDNIWIRGDVRGLRANIDAPFLSRGLLEQFEEERGALVTQLLWSVGVSVRF